MSWSGRRAFGARRASGFRAGKVFALGACVAVLVGLTGLVTGVREIAEHLRGGEKEGLRPRVHPAQGRLPVQG
jgi:hypothetical protein